VICKNKHVYLMLLNNLYKYLKMSCNDLIELKFLVFIPDNPLLYANNFQKNLDMDDVHS